MKKFNMRLGIGKTQEFIDNEKHFKSNIHYTRGDCTIGDYNLDGDCITKTSKD